MRICNEARNALIQVFMAQSTIARKPLLSAVLKNKTVTSVDVREIIGQIPQTSRPGC
jgi:hypothetical protein